MIDTLTVLIENDCRKPSKHKLSPLCCRALYAVYVLPLINIGFENQVSIGLFKFPRVGGKDKDEAMGYASGFSQKLISTMTVAVATIGYNLQNASNDTNQRDHYCHPPQH